MPVGDEEVHSEVDRKPEQSTAVKLLCSRGGFDGYASAVTRGEIPNMFALMLGDFPYNDNIFSSKDKFETESRENRAAYALKTNVRQYNHPTLTMQPFWKI